MEVTYNGVSYTCTKALKGTDYVKLLDANNVPIATFEGVKNFSSFTISGGSWTDCSSTDDYPLAVVLPDGSIASSSRTCDSVGSTSILVSQSSNFTDGSFASADTTLYSRIYTVQSGVALDEIPPGQPIVYLMPQGAGALRLVDFYGGARNLPNTYWFSKKTYGTSILGAVAYWAASSDSTSYSLKVEIVSDKQFSTFTYGFYPDIYITFCNNVTAYAAVQEVTE